MALDIYSWLTYRVGYLKRPSLVPWEALWTQFGADYARLRDFRRYFVGQLARVVQVYPDLRLSKLATGLLLRPSPTHIRRRAR